MKDRKPILGITMGDPAGIGPEIIAMALARDDVTESCRPLVIGDAATMQAAIEIVGARLTVTSAGDADQTQYPPGTMPVLDLENVELDQLERGAVHPAAGRAAYECLNKAIDLALTGKIHAIVTAPLNKEALNAAGYHYAGHTEILADRCRAQDVTMMLVSGQLRVSHVSTHVALREACDRVRKERILTVISLTDEALRRMGVEHPSIAVAGLNPHASDGGLFGGEELEEIQPAVKEARERGFDVVGPLPPDTIFYRAVKGTEIGKSRFDAVVAMYHDQGHIPIKMLGLLDGVNVTLGLPIIRTSVDHGTAFGKAGEGTADPNSLIEAIRLAVQMTA